MKFFPFQSTALGTWPLTGPFINHGRQMGWGQVEHSSAIETVRYAYQNGIRWFDTADAYGDGASSKLIAEALKEFPRDSYGISLKVGYSDRYGREGNAAQNILDAIHRSLDALRTDYVDLFSFHHLDFGPKAVLLEDAIDMVSQLKQDGHLRRLGFRFAHVSTVTGGSDNSTSKHILDRLNAVAPDSIHAKMNLLCSPLHKRSVSELSEGRQLFINKPFAQGLLWRLFESREWVQDEADHRFYRAEFKQRSLAQMAVHVRSCLSAAGIPEAKLPALALEALRSLASETTVIFGAKSSRQVRDFIWLSNNASEIRRILPEPSQFTLWRP